MNKLKIDLKLLAEQQEELNRLEGMIDSDVLAGLNELFDSIQDIAEDHNQEDSVSFVMEIK